LKILFDTVRRLPDNLGRPGIEAKRGQTNKKIQKQGFLRLQFKKIETAKKAQDLIDGEVGQDVATSIKMLPLNVKRKIPGVDVTRRGEWYAIVKRKIPAIYKKRHIILKN
jgi:hypothetical protein